MGSDLINPISPVPQGSNDDRFFSSLHAKDAEKTLKEQVVDHATREAFKEFASHHPNLVYSSPILNRVATEVKELDFKDMAEYDAALSALQGIHHIANRIYSLTFGHFSKSTEELEQILINTPGQLADYIDTHLLSTADVDMINAYIESGLLDLQKEGKALFDIPGMIFKLLHRKQSSAPWVEQLAKTNPTLLSTILTFEILPENRGITTLFDHYERLFAVDPNLVLNLLEEDDPLGNHNLTKSEYEGYLTSWIESLSSRNPEMMLAVLGTYDNQSKTLLMSNRFFTKLIITFEGLVEKHSDALLELLGKQDSNGNTVLSQIFSHEQQGNMIGIQKLKTLFERLGEVNPQKTVEVLGRENKAGKTILTSVWKTRLADISGLYDCLPTLKVLAKHVPHEVAKLISKCDSEGKAAFNITYLFSWLLQTQAVGVDLLRPVIAVMYEKEPASLVTFVEQMIATCPARHLQGNMQTVLFMIRELEQSDPETALGMLLVADPSGNLAATRSSDWTGLIIDVLEDHENEAVYTEVRSRFLKADSDNNTIFHRHMDDSNSVTYSLIADALHIDLKTLRNRYGLVPLERKGRASPRKSA